MKAITVRTEGKFSRVITVTKVIPKEWQYVTLEVVKQQNGTVILKIERVV